MIMASHSRSYEPKYDVPLPTHRCHSPATRFKVIEWLAGCLKMMGKGWTGNIHVYHIISWNPFWILLLLIYCRVFIVTAHWTIPIPAAALQLSQVRLDTLLLYSNKSSRECVDENRNITVHCARNCYNSTKANCVAICAYCSWV